jgi:hypothetical protein
MDVEFTARKVKISKALRTQAEEGMERIARILGKNTRASLTFSPAAEVCGLGQGGDAGCGAAAGHRTCRKPGAPPSRSAH